MVNYLKTAWHRVGVVGKFDTGAQTKIDNDNASTSDPVPVTELKSIQAPLPVPLQVPDQEYMRSVEGKGIWLEALLLGPQYVQEDNIPDPASGKSSAAFLLTLTTHSGDLLDLDLSEKPCWR